jgi:dipeptidyl aminopeptidase/acylaminoacyl peptidase
VHLSKDASDDTPALSPDGQSIAFSSARDNSPGIFVMDRRGESVRRLTNGGSDPSWTPDSRELVYSTESGRDPDNRQATDVVTGQRAWLHPDLSRDGRFLALRSFKAQEDIWVVGVDGSGLRPVTNDPPRERGPRWAPDGSLLFYSARNGRYQFWTIQPDGSGIRQLTRRENVLNDPVPSRDGRWVGGSNPNTGEQFTSTRMTGRSHRIVCRPRRPRVRSTCETGHRMGHGSLPPIHRVCYGCSTLLQNRGSESVSAVGRGGCPTAAVWLRRLAPVSCSSTRRHERFARFIKSQRASSARRYLRRTVGVCISRARRPSRTSGRCASADDSPAVTQTIAQYGNWSWRQIGPT